MLRIIFPTNLPNWYIRFQFKYFTKEHQTGGGFANRSSHKLHNELLRCGHYLNLMEQEIGAPCKQNTKQIKQTSIDFIIHNPVALHCSFKRPIDLKRHHQFKN